ncbi:Putative O-sialoglycoprotein endopeptidase [Acidilobus saccharovorans 345-15]|uniref:tRNA N6-adenosine threonylcarbamoyltransferase n=1 Tax=Acidilobus saccharovorans (strain DSM 16705 / JCM 18335 / VKM B-2471 / 345-15) TaxID=666510 RepID=D9Q109_ACIS3|nr:KEOPS complex N(6)-L-threonylcarbamoyladenine synthase Kae1 [Acidilobus saccharovorans]ADL18997.1 Putative O-sialoglycoprotein endopeptidase [Acidilobus saccharovorans 345-15]
MATAATRSSSSNSEVIVLGIESTAHTFGVGASRWTSAGPELLKDARRNYVPKQGGILPREVAQFFSQVAAEVVEEALSVNSLTPRDLDAIAVALGPGMGPQLRVGATVARAMAAALKVPLVPVNHAVAHLEVARYTTGLRDPVILYVSGGNTAVTTFVEGRYRVFGETLDMALGNLLDTFAREVKLGPPYVVNGNHVVDACAEGGEFIGWFPYVVKGQDVSYSGLLTAALRALRRGAKLKDVCYTLREVAFSAAVEVTERCLAHTGKRDVVLTGGVAANRVLNSKLDSMARLHGGTYRGVPAYYSGDNGAMISLAGLLAHLSGVHVEPERAFINQRWRLDEVEVPWYGKLL